MVFKAAPLNETEFLSVETFLTYMETFGHWVSLHYARVETVPWKQAENAQQRLKLNPADSFSSAPKSSE